jgi:predicted dehydrogenase
MGQNHLRVLSLLKGIELRFISDSNPDILDEISKAYDIPAVVDPTGFFSEIDAVIICTPTSTHSHFIRLAAERVRNIFVEKPLASTLEESRQLHKLTRDLNLNLQVGFIERYNPAVRALRSVLNKTERVICIDFTRTNKLSSRITDVDVVTDLMIHDIDLALAINGPPKSVVAHGYRSNAQIDFASALITHANGQFSRIQASRVTDRKIRQIQCTCIDMFVECDLLRKEIVINRQSETGIGYDMPYTISAVQEAVAVPPQEALLSELQDFARSCSMPDSTAPGTGAAVLAMEVCTEIQDQIMLR